MKKVMFLFREEYEELMRLKSFAQRELDACQCEERLFLRKKKKADGSYIMLYRGSPGSRSETQVYIKIEETGKFAPLVRQYCANRLLSLIKNILKKATDPDAPVSMEAVRELYEELYRIFGENTPKEYVPVSVKIQNWSSVPNKTPYRADELIYATAKGEKVRSKFEALIANVLQEEGIAYRYERKLRLKTGDVLPDFTLADPRTGVFTYLEAMGMMDEKEYAEANMRKLQKYAEVGLFPGDGLMLVFDSLAAPFNAEHFRQQLRKKYGLPVDGKVCKKL